MHHLLPTVGIRSAVLDHLRDGYDLADESDITTALRILSRFYAVPMPRIHWCRELDGGTTLGRTWSDGVLWLIEPIHWPEHESKRFRATRAAWIRTLLHEWHHYLVWVDDEVKADRYAAQFVRGTT